MKTRIILIISILAMAGLLSACAPSGQPNYTPQYRSLYINANGTSELTPDIAYVNIGVHTESESAVTAVDMNNTHAQKVLTALQNLGVAGKDLRTTNFSISNAQKTSPETGQVIGTYYIVENFIIVTVRDLPKMGSLLDSAIKAGANYINNIQFDVSDDSAAMKVARDEAMDNALQQAQEMADAAGFQLGDIQYINYSQTVPMFSSQYTYMDYGKGGGGGMRADYSVPVNPGQLTLTATVSLTYAIK